MYFLTIKYDRDCWKTAYLILSLFLKRGSEADWKGGRGGGGVAQYFVLTDLNLNRLIRAFSLTWSVARQIYYSKRRRKQEKRGLYACLLAVALPTSWFAFLRCFAYLKCLIT